VRYTVDIPEKLVAVFKKIAGEEDITLSELLRRSLLTYAVLHKEVSAGNQICITHNGKVEKELILGWAVLK
jgi:hypothetical protein